MKVLHLVHQYPPEFVGGVELYTQALAQAISRRGWQSAVFHRSYSGKEALRIEQQDAVTLFRASAGAFSPSLRFLSTWRQPDIFNFWKTAVKQFRPDVVHVQHLMGLPVALLEHLNRVGIPYLVTLHDYWWICANANLLTNYSHVSCDGPRGHFNCTHCAVARTGKRSAWAGAPLLWGLLVDRNRRLKKLLRQAAVLLTPSDFVRRWHSEHGIPDRQLRTVKLGIPSPDATLLQRRPKQDELALLYVGGLAPNKGVHILLEAFRNVKGNLRLSIVGDLSSHPHYTQLLRQMADTRVTFLGRLSRQEVWRAMADADAVAVPSLWHETFCLVAHEALAVGTPVLASAMGALPEAIQDGVNGLLLPAGDVRAWSDALQRLVDHPQTLEAMRSQSVDFSSFEQHVDRIESIYREILENRP
ncbi:MAG: glycosyltransferase family 4 protein [Caldilinea sp.]|uniref:glycosyltransferase family 4 protein n=1 Tax=Caldilinea sp. TaxID=2293560 RepID=UPI0030A8F165